MDDQRNFFFTGLPNLQKKLPLLIFDGHLSHVSVEVIEKAIEENVVLLKLPPHATDKLQPLDVACFGPLKRHWKNLLNEWVSICGPTVPIRQALFADKLGEIWRVGLSDKNIQAGFRATGIFPTDKSKYPEHRLDPGLLKRYQY